MPEIGMKMDYIYSLFYHSVDFIEYLGTVTGLGYELTHILLFFVLQPLITITLIILLILEIFKNRRLQNLKIENTTSMFLEFAWRISRILSISFLFIQILSNYFILTNTSLTNYFPYSFLVSKNLLFTNFLIFLILTTILLLFNFLIFGKLSLWLKRP